MGKVLWVSDSELGQNADASRLCGESGGRRREGNVPGAVVETMWTYGKAALVYSRSGRFDYAARMQCFAEDRRRLTVCELFRLLAG